MVILYGGLELFLGLTQAGSNIAHFAHLGGMIFGFFLIKYWQSRKNVFY
jgi:membrane associated rhomboid family serine protease